MLPADHNQFKQTQFAFTAHLRDPERQDFNGIENRRLKIYRELIYNNIDNFLSNGLPVTRKILSDEHWHTLVRDFLIHYRAESPYFHDISKEFYDYLQVRESTYQWEPVFLIELIHYEWAELALGISQEENDLTQIDPNGELATGIPVISKLAWILTYQFPVHKLSPDFQLHEKPDMETHLVVHRDRKDEVKFTEINRLTAVILKQFQTDSSQTTTTILTEIAAAIDHIETDQVIKAGVGMLEKLRQDGIILGTLLSK